ncbi:hypothetical protein [Steroidobacter sp.]|uniref:hypothetical protein n=1 Tax=Steroidobacter sp. TaxID=1978227 RepID=UPI001A573106|nr:hypothetical protein [Steroidobacter sp.]MBL8269255.1 hypothetical protein [Steroidobacter sp.]
MATKDDTSKRRGSRCNQSQAADGATNIMPTMPEAKTLEEAIANVRTLMMQVRGMLYCLSEVLQYADDEDSVLHAEVARAGAGWMSLAAAELDPVKLKPLIDALKRRGGSGQGGAAPAQRLPYQVREPRAVYLV